MYIYTHHGYVSKSGAKSTLNLRVTFVSKGAPHFEAYPYVYVYRQSEQNNIPPQRQ